VRSLDAVESDFCDRALGEVSRTFALSIRCLPTELRDAVRAAYLLCRIVDTIEDDRTLPSSVRAQLFEAFDAAIHAEPPDGSAAAGFQALATAVEVGRDWERTLCRRAATVFRAFSVLPEAQRVGIRPRILEMSSGMRAYSERADREGGLRIGDVADLERYCHYVAGTVGLLLTDLFLLTCPVAPAVRVELDARASRFGLGLQFVNILKDVAEDAERGDCLLPATSAREHGVELDRLFEPCQRDRALALCRFLSRRAREHLGAAEEYTLLWPHTVTGRDARAFCAGPLALALGTLREIELGTDTLVLGRAPTVSRDFVVNVFGDIGRSLGLDDQAESDLALRALFDRARVGIAGRPSRPPVPPSLPPTPTWPSAARFPMHENHSWQLGPPLADAAGNPRHVTPTLPSRVS
jgi:farnesyl-diphosphate farnesyltransferase